jgi:hypothetical protein
MIKLFHQLHLYFIQNLEVLQYLDDLYMGENKNNFSFIYLFFLNRVTKIFQSALFSHRIN